MKQKDSFNQKNNQGLATFTLILIILLLLGTLTVLFFLISGKNFPKTYVKKTETEKNANPEVNPPLPFIVQKNKTKNFHKALDSDNDGISDVDEINIYKTDPKKKDTDGDGLSDWNEILYFKTDPKSVDTNKNGIDDKTELNQKKDLESILK